jgi:ribosomal protein S15P/S13E
MHSNGKGIADSALPYKRTAPAWLKITAGEVEEHVSKLAKKGFTPSQIGVHLRDSYGIAQVRSVTGQKILRVLKKQGACSGRAGAERGGGGGGDRRRRRADDKTNRGALSVAGVRALAALRVPAQRLPASSTVSAGMSSRACARRRSTPGPRPVARTLEEERREARPSAPVSSPPVPSSPLPFPPSPLLAGLASALPEDLYFLIKKAVSVRKHLERNRNDKDSKFRLILIESRIHRIARYYKQARALPPTWRYESATASTLVA